MLKHRLQLGYNTSHDPVPPLPKIAFLIRLLCRTKFISASLIIETQRAPIEAWQECTIRPGSDLLASHRDRLRRI